MQYLAVVTIIVFLAYTASLGLKNKLIKNSQNSIASLIPIALPVPSSSPVASTNPTEKPLNSPKTSSIPASTSSSKIEIHTDINSNQNSGELIIYPGATMVSDEKHYQTNDSGETVYSWYKQELEKRSFQIRNNVKASANDKFRAVLQGVSSTSSFKVIVNQENLTSKTDILLE